MIVEVVLPFDAVPVVVRVDEARRPRRAAELRAQAEQLAAHRAASRLRTSGRTTTTA